MNKSRIVMIGPSLESWGGISAVANVYKGGGLFDRWPISYISSYEDGSLATKARAAFAGFRTYISMLFSGNVAALHVHSASRWGFLRKSLFVLPTLAFNKPVIFHLHGAEFINVYERELGVIGRRYVRFILDRCAAIVVLSERWKAMLAMITRNPTIRVIMNPIDSSTSSVSDRRADTGILLFLGALGERKGIYVLLEAVTLLDQELNWRLLVGGNGDVQGVQHRIEALGIADRVELLGWVNGQEKADLLDTAVALVLPSYAEGLPMSMLEAMAHGTAVVTTPVGGIPDLFEDGVDGFLVAPGDAKALARAIDSLLRSPSIAKRMGEQGRKKFEARFSSDVIIPQVEALYKSLDLRPSVGDTGDNTP